MAMTGTGWSWLHKHWLHIDLCSHRIKILWYYIPKNPDSVVFWISVRFFGGRAHHLLLSCALLVSPFQIRELSSARCRLHKPFPRLTSSLPRSINGYGKNENRPVRRSLIRFSDCTRVRNAPYHYAPGPHMGQLSVGNLVYLPMDTLRTL